MRHLATASFWRLYRLFPPEVRRTADRQFALLSLNPRHPSLHFKPIPGGWSARVTLNVRALARRRSDGTFVWFWIGSHDDYDKLIKQA